MTHSIRRRRPWPPCSATRNSRAWRRWLPYIDQWKACRFAFAPVAQRTEQARPKRCVGGSIPSGGAEKHGANSHLKIRIAGKGRQA